MQSSKEHNLSINLEALRVDKDNESRRRWRNQHIEIKAENCLKKHP
jgi:hypothetical protein